MKARLVLGAAALVGLVACGSVVEADQGADTPQATTTVLESEAGTTTTTAATTTTKAPTTTTTLPPTTTTTLPIIAEGVYIVPDELAYGVYRHTSYMARLDESLDIIDNDLVFGEEGFGLMVVLEGDAYVEISGEAILYDELGPVDPVLLGFTNGRYVVNYDIQPGRYRVTAEGDRSAYWARLDETLDIIDNDLGDGQRIVIVEETDFALEISGTIEPLP